MTYFDINNLINKDFAFVSQNIIYVYKEEEITPEGYVEPANLDEDFEYLTAEDTKEAIE